MKNNNEANVDSLSKQGLQSHHRQLTKMMSSFMKNNQLDDCIHEILEFYMRIFNGDRAYIFEYDKDYTYQDCVYEVASNPALLEKDNLQNVPVEVTPWWTQQMINDIPIFVTTLDQLPPEASCEYEILDVQHIVSIMVMPLVVHEKVWGYIGVDLVNSQRVWTELDVRKLDMVANIVSLCIELHESRIREQREYQYLIQMQRNLPLSYKRMKMLTDEQGKLVDYIIVDANDQFFEAKGWQREKVIGRKGTEVYAPVLTHLGFYEDVWNQKLVSNEFIHYEEATDKYIHWIVYSPVDNELVALGTDITEHKRNMKRLEEATRKAEEANRLKSAFLANMSHEIRTPLHVIMGFADLIAVTDDEEERKEFGNILKRNSEMLNRLMEDILFISKIEAGVQEFVFNRVDANELCKEVSNSLASRIPAGVEMKLELPLGSCLFVSDKDRLHQVLTNFLTNAIKFTSEGSIRMGYELLDAKHIRFYVADTGIGISEEDCKVVFERFVKLNNSSQGTGLGLPISSRIIQNLKGKIGVDSRLGEGSCFWFILPMG